MKTSRISESIKNALNTQMTKEAHASQIYLSYACWADSEGLSGVSNFFFRHAQEERNHMMKFIKYILERGEEVTIEPIPAPPADPKNIQECFERVFQHEVDNTKGVYNIVKLSLEEQDWATWNFAQWFVKEQIEEETMAMNLLAKIKVAGGSNAHHDTLYMIDRELEKMPDDAQLARDSTSEKP